MNPPDRTAIYRVSRNGHVLGEHDIDRIVELLGSGELQWTDLCWTQGMAGWGPLTHLRNEVAAAKAFPPVAAMPGHATAGRRRISPPPSQVVSPTVAPAGSSGWWWIVGGVTAGALVGLLCSHLFPTVVQVERPVEKVVEKPVEVVRTVEKVVDRTVERKADLSPEQREALVLVDRLFDPKKRTVGVGLFKLSNRVKVFYEVEGKGRGNINSGAIVSRVESAFRGHGFTVLPRDSKESPYSIVKIGGLFLEDTSSSGSVISISGSYRVTVGQPVLALNPFDEDSAETRAIKVGIVDLYTFSGAIDYGSNNFYKVPDVFARAAEECATKLRLAQGN